MVNPKIIEGMQRKRERLEQDANQPEDLPNFLKPDQLQEPFMDPGPAVDLDAVEYTNDPEPMPELPATEANVMEQIALKLNSKHDKARIEVGCTLINTFNFAIQVQAGRNNWQPSDYRSFIIALAALDRIGIQAQEVEQNDILARDVEEALKR